MLAYTRYFFFVFLMFTGLLVITPLCILRPFSTKNNFAFFKYFDFMCNLFLGIKTHLEGEEKLVQYAPAILIGNHQHNYDSLTVAKLFKHNCAVLGKFELGLLPYFGQIYVLAGNILVKRGNRKKSMQSMDTVAKKIIDKKLNILIFPEGHRNPKKELLPFKKGAYYTAIRTQRPLLPFSVSQFINYEDLNKFKKVHIYLKVHDPIFTEGKTHKDIPELISLSRKVITDGIEELNNNHYKITS